MWQDNWKQIADFVNSFNQVNAESAIRDSELRVLQLLNSDAGPNTSVDLAQKLGVSKPRVTGVVAQLVNQGLVVKVPVPDDGRSCLVVLSKKGAALVQDVNKSNLVFLRKLSEKMGEKKYESLMKLIVYANSVMQN